MSPSTLHIVGGDWHASSHLLHRRMYVAIGSPSMAHVLIRGTQGCLGTGRQDRAVGFALLLDGGAWSSPHIWHLSRGLAGLVIEGESALQQTCEVLVELLRGIDPKGTKCCPLVCVCTSNDGDFDISVLLQEHTAAIRDEIPVNHWGKSVVG